MNWIAWCLTGIIATLLLVCVALGAIIAELVGRRLTPTALPGADVSRIQTAIEELNSLVPKE